MQAQFRLLSRGRPQPAILATLKSYDRGDLPKDFLAGLTVGVVALPLSMAIAIASGAEPAQGLYAAVFAGIAACLLGGGRFQISGPSGTLVVVSYGVIAARGAPALGVATLLAGLILIALGASGLGSLIKYIPYPVTTGFTAGIGIIIFSQQVKDFAGLPIAALPPDFPSQLLAYAQAAGGVDPFALGVGLGTVGMILFARKAWPRVPSAIIGIFAATSVAAILGLPVETIGSRFGGIPSGLPAPSLALPGLALVRDLLPEAFTIALLVSIESLLSSVVGDGMTGDRHDSNMELMAQGAGNLVGAFFGGVPTTGAIARTATNIKAGARSPLAGVFQALVLLLFLLILAPAARLIPLASLAAVLMIVAWDMSDLDRVFSLLRGAPKSDAIILLVTLVMALTVGITNAVETGIVLAAFLFLRRMIEVSGMSKVIEPEAAEAEAGEAAHSREIEVFAIDGPFFFGVADMLQDAERSIERRPVAYVLDMSRVPTIDATGMNALSSFRLRAAGRGIAVFLAGVAEQPRAAMSKMGLERSFGEEAFAPDRAGAIARAELLLAERRATRNRNDEAEAGQRPPKPGRVKI